MVFFFPDYSPVEHETKKYIDYFPVKQEGNKPKQKQTQRLTPPPPHTTEHNKEKEITTESSIPSIFTSKETITIVSIAARCA